MAGTYNERHVRVHRDALTTNWGFRLQGGRDFKAPLTVQRVFVGSPADGNIHRGDVILAIENNNAAQMVHKQAMDLIKSAGGSLSLHIRSSAQSSSRARTASPTFTSSLLSNIPQYIRSRPLETTTPKPAPPLGKYPTKPSMPLGGGGHSYGVDYSAAGRNYAPNKNMLNRVQTSLEDSIYAPGRDSGYEETYQPVPVHDLKAAFQQSAPQYQGGSENGGEEEDDYQRQSVRDIKRQFNAPPAQQQSRPRPMLRSGNQSAFRKPTPRSPGTSSFINNNPLTMFKPGVIQQAARAQQNRPPGVVKPFRKPQADLPRSMLEPGWTPGQSAQSGYKHVQPAHAPVNRPANRPVNRPVNRPRPQDIQHFDEGPPAWSGSLRSSGGSRPWELHAQGQLVPDQGQGYEQPRQRPAQRPQPAPHAAPQSQEFTPGAAVTPHQPRVQTQHYGPGGNPASIGQADASTHEGDAKVAHLQYNTPIGLYSRQNVQETLDAQTVGKAGAGTMQVTGTGGPKAPEYNPATSATYKLIAEEEGRRQRPRGHGLPPQQSQQQQAPSGESARYQDHAPQQEMQYRGFQDHSRQSRSMHALEDFVANEGEGTSDF